jgi:mycofactocin system glycosyltransferase
MTPAVPSPPSARLPDGFDVRLDPRVRRRSDGALLGGSPLRMVRLSARARELLAGGRVVVGDATTAELAGRLLDAGLAVPEPPARRPDDVTVVIPVRDRPAELARLLAALRAEPVTADLPVVVVDDGSVVPVLDDGVRIVRWEESRGPAAARNAGLRTVTTPFVAFLDSDCVPRPSWLERLRPHLADPRLAVVAPRIVALGEGGESWVDEYEAAVSALDMGPDPAAVRPLSAVSYVPSAALLARRDALGDGFDEAMRVAEDVDLVWRLSEAGWRVRYEPGALVAHEHPARTVDWLRRRAYYGTGAALLAARHGSAVAPLVMAPESTLAWALAFAGGLVLRGQAASGRALARAATRHHWPLAVAAAAVSGRARRGLLAVAAADAVAAWWPQRHRVGPVRFAVARRLEDLAYGAGLWWGAVRARSPRALLPARPPR